MTEEKIKRWLQSAYGSVWICCSGLDCGADLKEISKIILESYRDQNARRG